MARFQYDTIWQQEGFRQAFMQVVYKNFVHNGFFNYSKITDTLTKGKVEHYKSTNTNPIFKIVPEEELVFYVLKNSSEIKQCHLLLKRLLQDGGYQGQILAEDKHAIVYDPDKVCLQSITSVTGFLGILKAISTEQLYYRGVPNMNYQPLPSIYRNKNLLYSEYDLYHEALLDFPREFKDCHNHFENLVQMQHYKLGTRLLDISSNPLVALYFACAYDVASIPYHSRIMLFKAPCAPLYPDHRAVHSLSALGFLETKDKIALSKAVKETKNIQDATAFQALISEVRNVCPGFIADVKKEELQRILFVKAALSNDRIIRQSGLFILAGLFGFDEDATVEHTMTCSMNEHMLKDADGKRIVIANGKCL